MMLRRWLVRLYPPAWRQRYGAEFEALLEECLHTPPDVLDILLGAVDAHLQFAPASTWRVMNMNNKMRTAILIVFSAYIAFVVAGMSLYGLADDSPMAALMKTGRDLPLLISWLTVQVGSVVALLSVVIGGLPLAWIVLRRALQPSSGDLRLLLVPVISFLALIAYAAFAFSVATGTIYIPGVIRAVTHENFPVGNRLLIGGGMLIFILGAISSTLAVWRLITRVQAAPEAAQLQSSGSAVVPYEIAAKAAKVTTAAMLVMLLGTLAWGWFSYVAMPDVFSQDWGLLQINTTASFTLTIGLMLLATAVAFGGLARLSGSRRQAAIG